MAEKQNPKERLKQITDSIETGIKELFESDKYKSYLQTMSRFHKYSFNNTMLIAMQKPDATLVAGFNKWRDGFSRHVKKGEKSIKIIAPTPYKTKEEREKLDPQTKAPLLDASGKVQTEEVEIQIPMFRVVSVFDVSQTEGEPLPTLASNLTGNVEQFEVFMDAIKRTAPVPIKITPLPKDTDGYYHTEEKRIAIREGMSEVQTVSATIHEVAHSLLHNREIEKELQAQQDENAKPIKPKNRNTEEVEAESISFAVCSYYGIQTAENSLGYIAAWSKGKELSELRASLETINKTSSELITGIDTHFAEIVKERGIDLTAETSVSEQAPHPNKGQLMTSSYGIDEVIQHDYPIPDPTLRIDDRNAYGYTSDELLPLSKERAIELWEQDLTVYLLYEDNTEAMAFDREDIDNHDGLLGIEKIDWLALQEHESDSKSFPDMSEQLFLERTDNAFAIYQLKDGAELRDYRFEGLDWIKSKGLLVEHENYNFVYTEPFTNYVTQRDRLAEIWDRFNNDHPADFKGHSLSVSDIVAIKQDGVVTYHYCDSFDFVGLPKFAEPKPLVPDSFVTGERIDTPRGSFSFTTMTKEQMEQAGYGYHHSSDNGAYQIMGNGTLAFAIKNEDNPLRTAELSSEHNFNQIDGIINNEPTVAELEHDAKSGTPISLMDLLDATRREEKQSVMEQLKTKPTQTQEKSKKAPSVGAEMER